MLERLKQPASATAEYVKFVTKSPAEIFINARRGGREALGAAILATEIGLCNWALFTLAQPLNDERGMEKLANIALINTMLYLGIGVVNAMDRKETN